MEDRHAPVKTYNVECGGPNKHVYQEAKRGESLFTLGAVPLRTAKGRKDMASSKAVMCEGTTQSL